MEKNNQIINGNIISSYANRSNGVNEKQDYKTAVFFTPLINDETTLNELIELLKNRSELEEAAKFEREKRDREEREARLLRLIPDECDDFEDSVDSADTTDKESKVEEASVKSRKRPGAIQLRSSVLCIGKKEIHADGLEKGLCEVFSNGYAVYDNGNRKTVMWLPEYSDYIFYFNSLRESEKLYQREYENVSEEEMGMMPWHIVLLMKGEDQIEKNLDHPKSQGSLSDFENLEVWDQKKSYKWTCGAYFENPEDAYIMKEEVEEVLASMSVEQQEAYRLHYLRGLSLSQIAKEKGVSVAAVHYRIKNGRNKFEKYYELT